MRTGVGTDRVLTEKSGMTITSTYRGFRAYVRVINDCLVDWLVRIWIHDSMQAGGFDRSDLWEAATGSRSSKPEAGAAAFCLRYIPR